MNEDMEVNPTTTIGFDELILERDRSLRNPNNELALLARNREDRVVKPRSLELHSVDFLGKTEDFKSIFSLTLQQDPNPFSRYSHNNQSSNSVFALHRIGNTLLVDSVPVYDFDAHYFSEDVRYQNPNTYSSNFTDGASSYRGQHSSSHSYSTFPKEILTSPIYGEEEQFSASDETFYNQSRLPRYRPFNGQGCGPVGQQFSSNNMSEHVLGSMSENIGRLLQSIDNAGNIWFCTVSIM